MISNTTERKMINICLQNKKKNIPSHINHCVSLGHKRCVESVVNEKKFVGAVKLKEGTTVDILTGTNKCRVAIYKATILKVCGE